MSLGQTSQISQVVPLPNVSKPGVQKSRKLTAVCYDIRGPLLARARQLEDEGHRIIKLNIGNLAPFGFSPPEEIVVDMVRNLAQSAGYSESKGLFSARKAVMHESQSQGIVGVQIDDIYLGNGVSELIVLSMQGLLNDGDEVLLPMPDYPLWTAAVTLSGGRPRHYRCDETQGWQPDLQHMESLITPSTKGLIIINPNNPTGAVYDRETLLAMVDMAHRHRLVIFSDEIYDKMLYDGHRHIPVASLSTDVLTVTFNGLSKNYRSCGFRAGWMYLSGDKSQARDYIEGLNMLASMRLCPNVPGQSAIQTALGGYQSVQELVGPDGRLTRQRDLAWSHLNKIPGVSCVKPKAALYMFPRLDPALYPITDDMQFALQLLEEEHLLVVQGTGFNWPTHNYLRIVFLPHEEELTEALQRFERFLQRYRQAVRA